MRKALVGESNYAEFVVLNDYLSGKGFEVHWVKTGPDAVSTVQQVMPDLMILDALIPGLTGLKVCQRVRKIPGGESVKTVLLSKVYRQFKEQYESRQTIGVDAYSEKPVNMANLDKVINRLVGDLEKPAAQPSPDPAAAAQEQEPDSHRTLRAQGSLSDTPFARLLFSLHKHRRTGALRVMHEQISKVIYVRDGDPVFVTSNLSNESLGRFLVQRGTITDGEYNASLERMLETGKQHGNVLLEMGALTSHELFEALQGQVREKVLRIFAWDDGSYEFRSGTFTIDESMQLSIPALRLILDGIKRFHTLTRLERYFNEYKNQRLRRVKKSVLSRGEFSLVPSDAKFFKLIDGRLTVGKIVARSRLSLSETFQLLYFLLISEAIRFVGDPGFAARGVKEQEVFLADRMKRQAELRDLKDDGVMFAEDRRRRFRLAVSRSHDLLHTANFYEMLKIPTDAGDDQIRSAYHTLAKQYRPFELYAEAENQLRAMSDEVFAAITTAYETLLDAPARRKYNEKLWGKPAAPEAPAAPPIQPEPEPAPEPAAEFEFEPDLIGSAGGEAADIDDIDVFADFVDETSRAATNDVDTPDIQWKIGADFSDGAETETDHRLNDFGAIAADAAELAEAGEVTADMANLVKSELAFQRGEDALRNNDFAVAQKHFTEAMEQNPQEGEYYAYSGWAVFLAAPDDPEARQKGRDLIEQAVSINPVLDSAHTFLGMIHLREGDRQAARHSFEQALQYNPENARARKELAKLETM